MFCQLGLHDAVENIFFTSSAEIPLLLREAMAWASFLLASRSPD